LALVQTVDIVLFGGPGAGKTSLVGALAEAAQSQPAVLHAQLKEVQGTLAELRETTYKKGPAPTREEVQTITVTLEPLPNVKEPPTTANLIDCSGAAAQKLLAGPTPPEAGTPLGRAVFEADAVLLVVDASAEPAELDRNFAQLGVFLTRFQEARGRRIDVAGLPLYLVLSKCDLLARPSDTHSQWMQRIEEGKRRVAERFQDFAERQADLPFGGVELRLWATAVKRPTLADRPAKPMEPYGVAELFRQVFGSAREFQQAREQASGRLSLAVVGTFGLILVLGLVAGLFYVLRPSLALTDLENQVRAVLPGTTTADRLREPLDERREQLEKLKEHALYPDLPEKLREEVAQAQREIEAYQQASKELLAKVTDPRFATREEELNEIAKKLDAFRLPETYAQAWNETKLAKRLAQWQFDLQKLRDAVGEEEKWTREQIALGETLLKQGGLVLAKSLPAAERDAWFLKVKEYIEREPRRKRSDRVAPGSSLTYDHVYKFQRVETARKEWDRTKEKLKELRNLTQ
jgi:hypothetical protein